MLARVILQILIRMHLALKWDTTLPGNLVELTILNKSASNCISLAWKEKLKKIRDNPEKWNELLRMELEACADEGRWGLGTQIVVARKETVLNAG